MRWVLLSILLLLATGRAPAEHGWGTRQQWQPHIESDQRLQKAVDTDIIGRGVVQALAILSEATGVSLSVAPENLETVGQRKLTVIPQGCTLKTIMVQIPAALRECHWDVDAGGEVPVYLLHRNSGAHATIAALRQRDRSPEELQARARAYRSSRLEAARRALAMPSVQLDKLEQSDILLARAVRDSIARPAMEALFSLPGDKMDLLLSAGEAEITFDEASAWLQDIAHTDLRLNRTEEWQTNDGAELFPGLAEELLSSVRFAFCFYSTGLHLILRRGSQPESRAWDVIIAVPAASCPPGCEQRAERLLIRTGTPEEEATEIVRRLTEQWQEGAPAGAEPEPALQPDSQLTDVVRLDCAQRLDLTEVQQIIARSTDMPVISDYFTMGPWDVPEEVRDGVPVWQLLERLSASADYEWQRVGHCLVFKHGSWYEMVHEEVPESVLAPYRSKLETGQDLSPRELVAIARGLQGLPYRERGPAAPEDRYAYDLLDSFERWALNFCDSMTEEQASALFSPEGLQFPEMREDQQAQFLAEIRSWAVADKARQAPQMLALHIRGLSRDREGTLEGSVRIHASFEKKACGGTSLRFRLPYAPARCPKTPNGPVDHS